MYWENRYLSFQNMDCYFFSVKHGLDKSNFTILRLHSFQLAYFDLDDLHFENVYFMIFRFDDVRFGSNFGDEPYNLFVDFIQISYTN